MQNSDFNPAVNVKAFRRNMAIWGLPLGLAELTVLAAVAKLFPVPTHITITALTIAIGFIIAFGGMSLFFLPLWFLSDHLHRRFGLVCPACGRWLQIGLRAVRCTRCCDAAGQERRYADKTR
jgi:hypothetical protein